MDNIHKLKYKSNKNMGEENKKCTICITEFEENE